MKNQKRHTVFMFSWCTHTYGVRNRSKTTGEKTRASHFVVLVIVLRGRAEMWLQSPECTSGTCCDERKDCCFRGFFYKILRHVKFYKRIHGNCNFFFVRNNFQKCILVIAVTFLSAPVVLVLVLQSERPSVGFFPRHFRTIPYDVRHENSVPFLIFHLSF